MKNRKKFIPYVFPIILLLIWQLITQFGLIPKSLSATPIDVIRQIGQEFKTWDFTIKILLSLYRLFFGLVIGVSFGIIMAFINATFFKLDRFFSPTLNFLAPIPIVIWIPFFIMIFGNSDFYKIGLISVSTFFLIYINLYTSYKSINKRYIEIGLIYEKKLWARFKEILFPHGLESLFTTIRLCIAIGWIVIYVTEYGNSTQNVGGLGYYIGYNRSMGNVEKQFAGVIVLALLSFGMDFLTVKLQLRYLSWKNKLEGK